MAQGAPELIAINHDDYHAKHVGKTAAGRQFFLTTPFMPAIGGDAGREFLALYFFDAEGKLLEAKIDDLGIRQDSILPGQVNPNHAQSLLEFWLSQLGQISFCDIHVAPFRIERFGIEFGLIPHEPEEEDENWWVTVEPGDYMAFYSPWDGDYDT